MKPLARAALLVAVLAALALGALALALPRMIASDATRTRIERAAESALGRELRYERLDVALLPPSVVVVAPVVAGATPQAPAFAEAQRLSLRIALLPLLAGRLLVDTLVVEGATLRLRRSAAGLELPEPAARAPAAGFAPTGEDEDEPSSLPVRGLELADVTLILEDAAVVPPVHWELRSVRAKLRGDSLESPLRVEASFELGGGSVEAQGTLTLAGDLDLDLTLEQVSLASLSPYLDPGTRLAGAVSGTLELEGPVRRPSRVSAQLELHDGDVELDEIALRGPMRLEADLAREHGAPSGRFDVDATDAELVLGGAFRKPAGTSATLSGRLVSGPQGLLGVDDVKLRVRDLDAEGKLRTGERMRLDFSAPPFDLEGWEALLPAFAGWRLRGPVAPGEIAFATSPPELHGRLGLGEVQATAPSGGDLLLRGGFVADGASVRGEGLELSAAGQPVEIAAVLTLAAASAPRLRLSVGMREADVDRLLAGFAGKPDALHGRLALDGELAFPLAADPLASAAGRVRFEVSKAQMGKESLIDISLDALAALSRPLEQVAGKLLSGGRRRAGDPVDSIAGTFEIAGGVARTGDLRIVERDRRVDLRGTLRLTDLALDMHGTLSLGATGSLPLRVPIAHVGGHLGKPQVKVTPEAARGLTAALSPERLEAGIERALGSETARGLVDELGGLLRRSAR